MVSISFDIKGSLSEFKKKFIAAIPVILFFLLLFYSIVLLFGTAYSLVVSFITATFKVRFQKKCTVRSLFNLFVVQMGLCVLAFFATLNLALCILLNIAVPFMLIYLQTTQFNQKGYFTNAMEFIFLQLRPVGWEGFLPLMGVMLYASAVLCVALVIYYLFHRKPQGYPHARKGLSLLSKEFLLMAKGEQCDPAAQKDMLSLQTSLHRMAYGSRDFSYVVRGEGKIHYMFALLFQRAAYFISDFGQGDHSGCSIHDVKMLEKLSVFLAKVEKQMNLQDNSDLIAESDALCEQTEALDKHFQVFLRNFLRLLSLTLTGMTEVSQHSARPEWKLPKHARPLGGLRTRLKLDTFEVRFALRLSLVSTISFVVCRVTNSEHSYWLPLNAFLLLQPMYEESAYRMKTRLIGTSIGCLLAFFVLPILPGGVTGHLIFATVMISLMYCCTPGTWVQPIFSTGFALTLASLTIESSTAIELRILYLVLAVVLVLVINRFFFPTSQKGQFRYNVRELFHIQSSYLTMLSISTRRVIDYGVVSDALISFHLLYDEVRKHLPRLEDKAEAAFYTAMLSPMWKMIAESEQMIFFVQAGKLPPQQREAVDHFSRQMKCRLQKIQAIPPAGKENPQDEAYPIESPYLNHLMLQYESNLNELGNLVEKSNLFLHAKKD